MESFGATLVRLESAVLVYFVIVNTFYALLLVSAGLEMRRHHKRVRLEERSRILGSHVAPTVTVLAPTYNEGATVQESVRALLTLRYPRLEVLVVNDGSTDDTLEVLKNEFQLVAVHPIFRRRIQTRPVRGLYRSGMYPGLVVVDKDNGGKADALNVGLNVASGELVCAIDADTLIEPDALLRMTRPFLTRDGVVAAGGTIRVANGSRVRAGRVVRPRVPARLLPGVQIVEYLRAFTFGRLGWNRLGGNLIISGAFGLFRREVIIEAGGYLHETVGEDMEIVARIRATAARNKTPGRVDFVPDPVAWTEVPESLAVLARQRDRWHRGLADTMWRHRRLFGNPRYGALGTIALPYFVLIELFGPIVEALGLVILAIALATQAADLAFAAVFFLVAYGYALVLNLVAIAFDEFTNNYYRRIGDRALLFLWAIAESVGYRQLTIVWRLKGLAGFVRKRTEWGLMPRTGFETAIGKTTDAGHRQPKSEGSASHRERG